MPKIDLKTLHSILRGSFATKWDENCDSAARVTLTAMLAEYGPDRTHAAVIAFTQNEQFWTPANLRKYVPSSGQTQRETCPKCASGFPGPGFIVGKARDAEGKEYECVQSCKHGGEE